MFHELINILIFTNNDRMKEFYVDSRQINVLINHNIEEFWLFKNGQAY